MSDLTRPTALSAQATPDRAATRGFQPLRDLPTVLWLLLLVAASIFHRDLPAPGWLMLHLLFLGAITHAILTWSQHFSFALTRTPHTIRDRRGQNTRLALANLGSALIVVGVPLTVQPVTIAGTVLLITAVIWHGINIFRRMRAALPGRFTRTVRYYVASAAFLPIGAGIGAWVAGPGDPSGGLVLAHAIINVLGWVGITVAGTLVTLWPTMLRTRADDRAASHAATALPVLAAGVLVAAAGAVTALLPLILLGLATYIVGLGIIAVSLMTAARGAPPRSFATLSAGSAVLWWVACMVALAVQTSAAWVGGSGLVPVRQAIHAIAPFLAAGFAAQVLIGALSYLAPVVIGGGPTPVRIGTATLDRLGPLRIAVANVALFVCALPVSSLMRVAASVLVLLAMASFLPLLIAAIMRQGRAKRSGESALTPADTERRGPITPEGEQPPGRRAGQAVTGLLLVMVVTAAFAIFDAEAIGRFGGALAAPASSSANGAGGADSADSASNDDANAPVQRVHVTAADMRFTPDRIEVPHGTRLIIELENTDPEQVHDLALANGARSTRLAPGGSETIDAGVITGNTEGWCTIVGHRQMGMTLEIVAVGTPSDRGANGGAATGADTDTAHGHAGHSGASGSASNGSTGDSAASLIDLARAPGAGFEPYPARLDPLPTTGGPVTHRIELPVTEQVMEVAPGVRQRLWTFGGSAPGPVLHGRVGDTFEITLSNDGTVGHSIDFHAGALAPDEPMRTIAPGESLVYTFTATRAGIWMYHCSTMPMSAHIANGMYGAVVIEPAAGSAEALPPVDHSYVLVQGEYYLGPQDGEVDVERLAAERPDLVVFNGYAAQYDHAPLAARVGERVRLWLLDAGPNRAMSFHVVGGQFDTVWAEGRYLVDRASTTGSQALALQPAQGGFVELTFPEAGHYPFVSHIMIDAERGAHGLVRVTE